MLADLSQSLERGDPILVGLICMDLGKEQHEEQGDAEQGQGEKEGIWSLSHLLSRDLVATQPNRKKKDLEPEIRKKKNPRAPSLHLHLHLHLHSLSFQKRGEERDGL